MTGPREAELVRIRAEAAALRANLQAPPPVQQRALTEDERRERCPTGHLWPIFKPPM